MDRVISAEPFLPGEVIQRELDARGWTQDDLADVTGRTRQHVNRLLQGHTAITADTAQELAAAFGTSATLWMNLQTSYELAKAAKEQRDIERRAKVYEKYPVRDLKRRRWIGEVKDTADIERSICRFLGTASIDDVPALAVAARKGTDYTTETGAQLCWYMQARRAAELAPVTGTFRPEAIDEGIGELRKLMGDAAAVRRVPRVLSDIGIKYAIVEHLPGSRVDGVAFRVDGIPAIVMSLRCDRIDNFWFTLLHEVIHVKHGDETRIDVDVMSNEEGLPEVEVRANREASDYLIPHDRMESFYRRHAPLFYTTKIMEFARARGVHPGIVAGQLRFRTKDYTKYSKLLVKVREHIAGQAITDGWGHGALTIPETPEEQ